MKKSTEVIVMENYDKRYNDMVKRARELHEAGNALTKKQMEIVCPELAESEDERITDYLLDFISHCSEENFPELGGVSKLDILSWIKKQKEQKSTDEQNYYGPSDFAKAIQRLLSMIEQKEQKPWKVGENAYFTPEQKPVEWSEEDENCRIDILYYLEDAKRYYPQARKLNKCIKWFKSLRPSWKPSEEQMEALWKSIEKMTLPCGNKALVTLYEDLKKL